MRAGRGDSPRTPWPSSRDRDLFGDLVDDERFVAAYRWSLDSLHAKGARATLEALAGGAAA